MIYSAGDLGITIDYGNNEPGSVLQRASITFPSASGWEDYMVDGKRVKAPVDIESLPPGEYRLVPATTGHS